MDRTKQLTEIFDSVDENVRSIVLPMIGDVVFLESQLRELKKLPFIRIHPSDPSKQKPTAASKMYKELLQQYNNCIKILCMVLGRSTVDEIDPVAEFLEAVKNGN